jgi:hypothetical protein
LSCSPQSDPLAWSGWGSGCQVCDLLHIGCVIVVGDQGYHTCVICKL